MRKTRALDSNPGLQAQAGLTLVELLVSMVILGFVMLLVSETVKQVAQVARAADDTTRGFSERWSTGWSASELFANLVAPPELGEQPVLKGSTQRVEGFTTRPLSANDTGIEPFALELRPRDDGARTDLMAESDNDVAVTRTPSAVAQFAGRAEFSYIDREGRLQPAWPPPTRTGETPEDLPQVVMIRDAGSKSILMWFGYPGEYIRQKPNAGLFGAPQP